MGFRKVFSLFGDIKFLAYKPIWPNRNQSALGPYLASLGPNLAVLGPNLATLGPN